MLGQTHTAKKQGGLEQGPVSSPLSATRLCTPKLFLETNQPHAHSHLQAELEIQRDALEPGQKVVVVDDLLATGGEGLP